MTRAELKKQAKDTLRGRWGTAIAMVLLFEIITGALSMMGNYIVGFGTIAVLVITVPISYGFIGQLIKFSRNEQVGVADFFNLGFSNFKKSWSIVGHTLLKLLPYIVGMILSIVLIVGSIIYTTQNENITMFIALVIMSYIVFFIVYILMLTKSYLYVLPEYIGNDTEDMTAKQIVEKSAELMKGHRMELFILELSFIGWMFLALFTCGIGLLWLMPYMQITSVKFYEYVAGINETSEITNN